MITDTMSYADIAKELEEDYKNVVRYQVHLPVKKYMKEVMNRPDGKVLFKTVEWTSPRHNKMLLTPFSRNKKDARKNGLVINVCCVSCIRVNSIWLYIHTWYCHGFMCSFSLIIFFSVTTSDTFMILHYR